MAENNQPTLPDDDSIEIEGAGAGAIMPLLMTAVVFAILGAMMTFLFIGGDSSDSDSDSEIGLTNEDRSTQIAIAVNATLENIAPTATPLNVNDPEAVAQALDGTAIAQAVEATFVALTPTPTPLPTDVPVDLTFDTLNPSLGPEDAPVTMVEFSDYLCPYCARFHRDTLGELLDHYDGLLRFVYREYPIIGGETSAAISVAAQCANVQDKYWEYTDLIWEDRVSEEPAILGDTEGTLVNFAEAVDLDMNAFRECRAENGEGFLLVVQDYEAGQLYNIRATPGFFIEGVRFTQGAVPMEFFMDIIDEELRKKGIEPPARPTT